jgi:Flp pilus assembly protein CpaB
MSRRARALAFALLAIAAAAIAAAVANGYGSSIARSYGPLRQVVIARQLLPAGRPIGPGALGSALELRRVPARFVPPGTLGDSSRAVGLQPRSDIPPGSYVSDTALRAPGHDGPSVRPRLRGHQRPVAIQVSGVGGLLFEGAPSGHSRVDVVVTSEPTGAATGRTYVAAASVPLLALVPGTASAGPGDTATATLGLTRDQALDLIAAESFARQVTLLRSSAG